MADCLPVGLTNQLKCMLICLYVIVKNSEISTLACEEAPNLNHWLASNNPIGVPSNQKSKFLPFITRNVSSDNYSPGSSGGNSPVSSKVSLLTRKINGPSRNG